MKNPNKLAYPLRRLLQVKRLFYLTRESLNVNEYIVNSAMEDAHSMGLINVVKILSTKLS